MDSESVDKLVSDGAFLGSGGTAISDSASSDEVAITEAVVDTGASFPPMFAPAPTRKRFWPLVPEPFESLTVSRQGVFLAPSGYGRFLAKSFCQFLPILDVTEYRNSLNEDEHNELDKRASKLSRHANQNELDNVSEFSWEADLRSDVFGKMRDDYRLTIDKRTYEYQVPDKDGSNVSVKWKTPDMTLGLRTYMEEVIEHECDVNCGQGTRLPGEHRSLCKERLQMQMFSRKCGLVVDPKWGRTDLIFPFAVYEAKKKFTSYEQAESQMYHAARTYLAMLDDLARDPVNPGKYQPNFQKKELQMFCFTSSGPWWIIYVAFSFTDSCFVETFWEGDVRVWSRAYEFICIVDQIHEYAITQHRDFVIKHLEPWLTRAEELEGLADWMEENGLDGGLSASDHSDIDGLLAAEERSDDEDDDRSLNRDDYRPLTGKPQWEILKEKSRLKRNEKRLMSRRRKLDLSVENEGKDQSCVGLEG